MVISRTPFRISFFGGGTDYPVWFNQNRGKVISTTINKYCYITTRFLSPLFVYRYRIRYTFQEKRNDLSKIRHPSVRECLRYLNLGNERIEMQHNADWPARSGLGSSSAFTVGFLNSLCALTGQPTDKIKLANDAIHIEQNIIQENVGSQDQTAAAFGGFNVIEFKSDGLSVSPVNIADSVSDALNRHLMLFYIGMPRTASEIAKEQIANTPKKEKELTAMLAIADEAEKIIKSGNNFFDEFGRLLDESWRIKRTLASKISNPLIDSLYDRAKKAGATGGKLLGAGGGGFLLVYANPELHPKISSSLAKFQRVDFDFDKSGSQIIYKTQET